jgi:hypothetical protein
VCQYSFVYYKIPQIFYHDNWFGACLEVDEGACYYYTKISSCALAVRKTEAN